VAVADAFAKAKSFWQDLNWFMLMLLLAMGLAHTVLVQFMM
jgi:hypothetical protein